MEDEDDKVEEVEEEEQAKMEEELKKELDEEQERVKEEEEARRKEEEEERRRLEEEQEEENMRLENLLHILHICIFAGWKTIGIFLHILGLENILHFVLNNCR